MSVKRYSVWEDEMFDEKHALNPKNSMVHLMVMHEDYAALEVRCAALAAENAALSKDAQRYRFIRERDLFGSDNEPGLLSWEELTELECNDFDNALDARLNHPTTGFIELDSNLQATKTPATNAFLAEVRAQGVTEYASKRGFSFQHGCIHAHFGNGDVMVGAVTFENGDAGINFAPVREKTGGVGTSYEWTKGKTADQVDSVFIIASSNAEGLEVIRDKLNESIEELRKGVQS
ncbi:TPA: hypothetical protein ACTYPX_000926 [Enterobacter hormaechei]